MSLFQAENKPRNKHAPLRCSPCSNYKKQKTDKAKLGTFSELAVDIFETAAASCTETWGTDVVPIDFGPPRQQWTAADKQIPVVSEQTDSGCSSNSIPTAREMDMDYLNNNKRRKCGKWSKEEQAFADRLIDDFYRGISRGVENGQTLRTHLAQKLRCDPLRISKRFAGSNSLGKVQNSCHLISLNVGLLNVGLLTRALFFSFAVTFLQTTKHHGRVSTKSWKYRRTWGRFHLETSGGGEHQPGGAPSQSCKASGWPPAHHYRGRRRPSWTKLKESGSLCFRNLTDNLWRLTWTQDIFGPDVTVSLRAAHTNIYLYILRITSSSCWLNGNAINWIRLNAANCIKSALEISNFFSAISFSPSKTACKFGSRRGGWLGWRNGREPTGQKRQLGPISHHHKRIYRWICSSNPTMTRDLVLLKTPN